jgi:hypothetical protein
VRKRAFGQRALLLPYKVDEEVRKRVMREAVKTYAWPLDRPHLSEAAKEFFRRLPAEHQRTVGEVLGWDEGETTRLRHDEAATLAKIAALGDDSLARFLMLCSFAHRGANRDGRRRVDQGAVGSLSRERGVNHALIDATVRAELCPQKYRSAHRAYLEAVREGRAADKPVVYERAGGEVVGGPLATEAAETAPPVKARRAPMKKAA